MKNSIKLLLAAAIATSAPFFTTTEAAASGWGRDVGPRFVSVKHDVTKDGNLLIRFDQVNVSHAWVRYTAKADVTAVFRCQDARGRLGAGHHNQLVVRDTIGETRSIPSRHGRVAGELMLDYGKISFRNPCRAAYARPVLVRLTYNNILLTDDLSRDVVRLQALTSGYYDTDSWYDDKADKYLDDRYDDKYDGRQHLDGRLFHDDKYDDRQHLGGGMFQTDKQDLFGIDGRQFFDDGKYDDAQGLFGIDGRQFFDDKQGAGREIFGIR